jgi:hypothetical protein
MAEGRHLEIERGQEKFLKDIHPVCVQGEDIVHIFLKCLDAKEWRETFLSSKWTR